MNNRNSSQSARARWIDNRLNLTWALAAGVAIVTLVTIIVGLVREVTLKLGPFALVLGGALVVVVLVSLLRPEAIEEKAGNRISEIPPLALPTGSVRSIIGLAVVAVYVGVVLSRLADPSFVVPRGLAELALVVVGFYFGTRAGGGVNEAYRRLLERYMPEGKVITVSPGSGPDKRLSVEEGESQTFELTVTPRGEAVTWEVIPKDKGKVLAESPTKFIYKATGVTKGEEVEVKFSLVRSPEVSVSTYIEVVEKKQ